MGLAEILLAGLALLTPVAIVGAAVLQRRLAASGHLVERAGLRLAELERLRDARRAAALAAVVEGGTRTTRWVHHGIASIPFGILEAIPPTRAATRVVRVTHNLIADGVYGAITVVTRGVGKLLRQSGGLPDR